MTPRKNGESFTSFRVIGEKAGKLLAKARERLEKREEQLMRRAELPDEHSEDEVVVHLSTESVVKAAFAILAIGLGAYLVTFIQDTIVLLLLSIFLAAVINPGVEAMRRAHIPTGVGVLLIYFIALTLFVFLLVSFIPIVADQLSKISFLLNERVNSFLADPQISLPLMHEDVNQRLTDLLQSTLQNLSIDKFSVALQRISESMSASSQGALRFAASLAGSVLNFFVSLIIVMVFAFFIQIEKEKIISWTRGFLPRRLRSYADNKAEMIQYKIGQWARGQLLLGLSIGILVFIALMILRMQQYALTLAILAAFTELIPVIGPLLAAVPAVLIAFTTHGFLWGLVVAGVYYVIQWCENNLLVPLIMKRAVGLSPIAIMFAMLVSVSFPHLIHPLLGVMLSIPVTTIIALFLEDWRYWHSKDKS